jgi:fibronectin-binding autotransporter adhesin
MQDDIGGGLKFVAAVITLLNGAVTSGSVTISAGGTEEIGSGYALSGFTVSGGITLEVASGGTASNTTVSSGGSLVVSTGGFADPTVIYSGGSETVSAGGTDLGAQISGGEQDVYGSASGTTVFTGSQLVESCGAASNTIVSSGGWETISSGGTDLAACRTWVRFTRVRSILPHI